MRKYIKYIAASVGVLLFCGIECAQANSQENHDNSSLNTNTRIDPQLLKVDFHILREALEKGDPGIYRYTSRTEMDRIFDSAEKRIDQSMDLFEFYRLTAPVVAAMKCGHAGISLSRSLMRDLFYAPGATQRVFPAEVVVLDHKLFVLRDFATLDGRLSGSEILSINGVPATTILGIMTAVIHGDADTMGSSTWRISHENNFNIALYTLLGLQDPFRLNYRPFHTERAQTIEVNGVSVPKIRDLEESEFPQDHNERPLGLGSLDFRQSGAIAILKISGFGRYADNAQTELLSDFISTSFRQMQDKKSQALILDLRDNQGGQDIEGKQVFSFLSHGPFTYYTDLIINPPPYGFEEYAPDFRPFGKNKADKGPDGKFHNNSHPNLGIQEASKPEFSGKVFVLMNGGCFSTTAELLSILRDRNRATFIGSEAAGDYYGNTSGFFANINLPNSHLLLQVPMMAYYLDVKPGLPADRGVIPDYSVNYSIQDMLFGADREMVLAMGMAQKVILQSDTSRLESQDISSSGVSLSAIGDKLSVLIPDLMQRTHVPGVSVVVIDHGAIAWDGRFGVKDISTGAKVDDETLFEAASMSKPVLAYATLKLVDAGKFDLDAPLSKYLPDYIQDDPRINLITARRVLTHTAGLPNWRQEGKPLKIFFTPGEKYSYSGEGFVYLQQVLEHLLGQPIDELMQDLVFHPLGMKNTGYVWQPRFDAMTAVGHDENGLPQPKVKSLAGKPALRGGGGANAAAGLQTTALDYSKFAIALMNGEGLKAETARAMISSQVAVDAGCFKCTTASPTHLSDSISWGLGVGIQKTLSGTEFWQWGDNGVFKGFLIGDRERKRGVVIFANSQNAYPILYAVVEQVLGSPQPAFAWFGYKPDKPKE